MSSGRGYAPRDPLFDGAVPRERKALTLRRDPLFGDIEEDVEVSKGREERSRSPALGRPDREDARKAGRGRGKASSMVWGQHQITLENVPYDMIGLELKELARTYPWSTSLTFARTYRRGQVGYGMLEFTDERDKKRAMEELDGQVIEGSSAKLRCYEGNFYHEVWRPTSK
mmetsp:Transcript_93526/g.166383  ORF Transcript_93526/g.166383 Transcript_93526/m.166383 type:complete len:171 (+) Transcript_93526:60-572(+)|eukprot:CAMPEP_0197639220 /NCGR_PEP_ID=MMETSP1338-20131121/13908_1 /TAXON_ID=43686 ORGANISM="Pelagodinium beii, Strain RCC1491" /NCGR_SAMPLE_ID=MMETSP1338 /ASSEMBLY_ACC=CAM_ASM_000754 /LENGTH=170 /DNA_ID=CAMNT_0043211917 /DNA_START=53 /DNA_END=565 /DNA_ORIENTATION=-